MNQYLSSLFTQMKGAGQNRIYLSFAQLDNIDVYASGNFLQPGVDVTYDVIAQLLNQLQTSSIQVPGYLNFLDYFIAKAHSNGISVAVAFGGANAINSCYAILQNSGETYEGQAQKLAAVANTYGIDRLDFDIEDPQALSSQPLDSEGKSVVTFYRTLYNLVNNNQKTTSLTSMLSLNDWPNGALEPLFYNQAGDPIFTKLFNGLNLMAYSDTQYWIDANDISWGIEQWIDIIGKENAKHIHVGFNDGFSTHNLQLMAAIPNISSLPAALMAKQPQKSISS